MSEASPEPTPQEQRRYWDLEARCAGLLGLREQVALVRKAHGDRLPPEVLSLLSMVEEEHTRAEDVLQYFMFEHSGKAFQAFDPDLIEQAFTDEYGPLFPPEDEPD